MIRKSCFSLAAALLVLVALAAAAQEPPAAPFEVRAGNAQDVLVDETATFDAAAGSKTPPDARPTYTWFFGDGKQETGERVSHAYKRPGTFVVRVSATLGNEHREDETRVRVYGTAHLLLRGPTRAGETPDLLTPAAADDDILVTPIEAPPGAITIAEGITRELLERGKRLERAVLLFVWADGTAGPDILSNLGQTLRSEPTDKPRLLHMDEKGVVLVTDQPFALIARPAQTAFNVLRPKYIILARPATLPLLVRAKTADEALEIIRATGRNFSILGTHSERAVSRLAPWNALSYSVNALVNAGVPTTSIVLILMLPVVATVIAFSRQIIGIKAFGIFTPAAVTLSFLAIGLKYGLIIFVVVLLTATASRFFLRRFRLLYLPRMAIVLTAVSFAVLALFGVGAFFQQTGILAFSVFPILLLASLAEQFVEAQIRLGSRAAARLTAETLFLSVISTLIVSWETLRSVVVGFPELILLTIPANILIGRWTGLRLTEYVRFRHLLFSREKERP